MWAKNRQSDEWPVTGPLDAHRCGQPGQQHGRRIPSLSSEHTLFTCCRLVSSFLTEMVQQIHSLRARRYVFPRGACPGVGRERLSKIIWEVMNDSSRHLNSCHRGISPGVGLRADSSAC